MIKQDFLTTIRDTEDRAEVMIAEAQAEARQQVDTAKADADRRIARAHEEADELIRVTLEQARRQADINGQAGLDQTAEQAAAMRQTAGPAFEQAVRIVMERIVK